MIAAAEMLRAPDFDLHGTLESGQVFHWSREGDVWTGLIDRTLVRVEQQGRHLAVTSGPAQAVTHYFSLDHSLSKIYRTFPKDAFTREALRRCRGLRIIRQPAWECLATFLFSSMKQVAHIRKISLTLRERYGDAVRGSVVRTFPSAAKLAGLSEMDLKACGLGYRAKNLLLTAQTVADGTCSLEGLAGLDNDALRRELQTLPGIGPKVAACVMLFAFERLDAVPVDVWIDRVIQQQVGQTGPLPGKAREEFIATLGRYAGYLQQYWFHHARAHRALAPV